jgi:hypothetical protein
MMTPRPSRRTPSRHLFAALLGAALALAGAATTHAAVPRDFVGMTSDDVFAGDDNYRTSNLSSQATLGVGLLRQTFDWSTIERSNGSYDLSYYDQYVAKAAAHGIRILPVLFRAPKFHAKRPKERPAYPPKSNATMARFAQVLVRRYGERGTLWSERPDVPRLPIHSWQIWNEPLLKVYWGGRPNARAYTAMLKTVGRAIKAVDRRAEIVTAGLPPSKLKGAVPLPRFIRSMYRAGGKSAFDTIAINSYAKNAGELNRLLRGVRQQMNRSRDRRAKIWITELGWGDKGPRHRFIVGARGQAKRITTSFALIRKVRSRLRLRGVVYYSWRDLPPYPPGFKDLWGLHTGLLNRSGQPKRAFNAFKRAASKLR